MDFCEGITQNVSFTFCFHWGAEDAGKKANLCDSQWKDLDLDIFFIYIHVLTITLASRRVS